MKKFRFKFEALLTYRSLCVRKLEKELYEINTKARWFADRLLSIKEEIEQTRVQIVNTRLEGDLEKHHEVRGYLLTLEETLPAIEKAQTEERLKLGKVKKKVEEAVRMRKIIENLKKTHYTAYLKQQERKEEYVLDDLRTSQHPR